MYFWKTKELANKIKNNELTEADRKNYYLAGLVIMYAGIYFVYANPRSDTFSLLLEAILIILVSVIGINVTFKSNGGNSGNDYIARVVALLFPITIKIVISSLVVGIVIGFAMAAMSLPKLYVNYAATFVTVIFQALTFWRLNVAIKYVNT
jgi:hypothetical protein